jgi:hypothetical protein
LRRLALTGGAAQPSRDGSREPSHLRFDRGVVAQAPGIRDHDACARDVGGQPVVPLLWRYWSTSAVDPNRLRNENVGAHLVAVTAADIVTMPQ